MLKDDLPVYWAWPHLLQHLNVAGITGGFSCGQKINQFASLSIPEHHVHNCTGLDQYITLCCLLLILLILHVLLLLLLLLLLILLFLFPALLICLLHPSSSSFYMTCCHSMLCSHSLRSKSWKKLSPLVKIMEEAFTTGQNVQRDITLNSISVKKLWKPQWCTFLCLLASREPYNKQVTGIPKSLSSSAYHLCPVPSCAVMYYVFCLLHSVLEILALQV